MMTGDRLKIGGGLWLWLWLWLWLGGSRTQRVFPCFVSLGRVRIRLKFYYVPSTNKEHRGELRLKIGDCHFVGQGEDYDLRQPYGLGWGDCGTGIVASVGFGIGLSFFFVFCFYFFFFFFFCFFFFFGPKSHHQSLIQPSGFDEPRNLLFVRLLAVLLPQLVQGDDFLRAVDDRLDVNLALREPADEVLDLELLRVRVCPGGGGGGVGVGDVLGRGCGGKRAGESGCSGCRGLQAAVGGVERESEKDGSHGDDVRGVQEGEIGEIVIVDH